MVFFRQLAQRFGKDAERLNAHAEFAAAGVEQPAFGGDDVADVVFFELVITAVRQAVALREQLNAPAHVLKVRERGAAHDAPRHQPPRDFDPRQGGLQLLFGSAEVTVQIRGQRIAAEVVGEGVAALATLAKGGQLGAALLVERVRFDAGVVVAAAAGVVVATVAVTVVAIAAAIDI